MLVEKLLEEVDTRRASDCERLQRQTHTRAGGGRHGARARERERDTLYTYGYVWLYLMHVYRNTDMYKQLILHYLFFELCVPLPPTPHPLFRPNPQIYSSKNYIPEFIFFQTNNMSNPSWEIKYLFNLKKSRTRTCVNRWMVQVTKNEPVTIG